MRQFQQYGQQGYPQQSQYSHFKSLYDELMMILIDSNKINNNTALLKLQSHRFNRQHKINNCRRNQLIYMKDNKADKEIEQTFIILRDRFKQCHRRILNKSGRRNAQDSRCMYGNQQSVCIIYELQVEIQRLRLQNSSGQITYIQDDTRINELMQANKEIRNQEQQMRIQNKQLLEDLESWKSRYKLLQESNSKSSGLDEEIRQLKKKINELTEDLAGSHEEIQSRDNDILNLKQLLHDKDNELDQLDARIRELEMMCENYSQSETQIISLQGEVELWKKKFKQVNEQNSDLAEKLTMAETQLEAIKKRQVTVTKETEVRKSGTHGGGTTTSYEQNVIKGAQLLHPRGSQYLK